MSAVDFFNEISMVYGTISEYCTKGSCPTMSAGPNYQYRWADGVKIKKPIEVSAPEYVDLLLTWYCSSGSSIDRWIAHLARVETQLNDESIFPNQIDGKFPKNFESV